MSEEMGSLERCPAGDGSYPISFTLSSSSRAAGFVLSAVFGVAGAVLLAFVLMHRFDEVAATFLGVQGMVMLLCSVWSAAYSFKAKLTLRSNAIEFCKAFGTANIDRAMILGRRYKLAGRNGTTKYPVIIVRGKGPLVISPSEFQLDGRFEHWFLSLPDLDAEDRASLLAAIANDASLGSTAKERLAKLDVAKKFAMVLSGIVAVLCLWVLFFPRPYPLSVIVVVALPWVAALMAWAKPNFYQIYRGAGDVRGTLIALVLLPPFALGFRALFDVQVIDLKTLLATGVAFGLVLFVAIMTAPRRETAPTAERREAVFVLLPFLLVYGIASAGLVNKACDMASPGVYRTTITGKYIRHARGVFYSVGLAPWRDDIDNNQFSVSASYYYNIEKGHVACVLLHPGALGIRWTELSDCG